MSATVPDLLRQCAGEAERVYRENHALHRLLHVLARYLCRCPRPADGYREIHPECPIHRLNGLQELITESQAIDLDPQIVGGRRHLLNVAAHAKRRNCNCRLHGCHPTRKPWPGCPKHGTATRGVCRHG